MKKVLIAMSGGVDSSVAAYILKQQGYECVGCTMKLYDNEDIGISRSRSCCSLEDVEDAESVARGLGMPYYVFNFKDDFRERVIGKFVRCYEQGLTPNPCIDCNRYLKFDKLYARAQALGCDYIATGHYARVEREGERLLLKKAPDLSKDQSYVLYSLTQEQLAHTLFPLGNMRKSEVRAIAEAQGFVNAEKPDSQDICFVPDGDYAAFLRRYTGREYAEGDFLDSEGRVLGRHKGIVRYTVGQRKGLGLSLPEPLYVSRIDAAANTVILARDEELYSRTVRVGEMNWIAGFPPPRGLRCRAKIRYRQAEQPCLVNALPDGGAEIIFDEAQRAVTPGQAAVLYDGDTVLGGGEIRG